MSVTISLAQDPASLDHIRRLFREYADWLGADICFTTLDRELAELPGEYAPPDGRLFLASTQDQGIVGCIALRRLDNTTGELKRLYVRPNGRGHGMGRKLTETVITQARLIGYHSIRLDTLPTLREAIHLYESFGFRQIEPPHDAPFVGEVYYQLTL